MNPTAEQLAEDLVNALFSCGEPWAPITRIQLMSGSWEHNTESGQGGFTREPLIRYFTSILKQRGV